MEEHKTRPKQHYIRSIINFLQGIAFTIFIFVSIFAIYLIILYSTRLTPIMNYAIVFDAGSSHTEMFVYHWPADKSDGLGTTSKVNELFVCLLPALFINDTIKNGESIKLKAISDFEQNLDLLEDYFRPCLNKAISKIPTDRHKFAPIFLGATAGMRLTRLRNTTRAQQILERIREIFSNSPFEFVVARQVSHLYIYIFINK
jgi:Golgi nucleoside diphosphatase